MSIGDWIAAASLFLGILSWVIGRLVFDKFKQLSSSINAVAVENENLKKTIASAELIAVKSVSKLELECLNRDNAASKQVETLRRDTERDHARLIEQNHQTEREMAEQLSEVRETVAGFGAVYLSRKEFNESRSSGNN